MDLRPGTFVTDNVRLVRILREGAMGQVWVAEHLTLELQVAVKFMSTRLGAADGELRQRFIREAATAAKIKNPHVVQTHDQGFMSDGTPYIVMELLEGESLADRLQRDGSIGLPETGQIVLQVGRALTKAHALGIVHRDVKPENIFLGRGDDGLLVKVLDFGIARQTELPASGWDETDTLAGTPQYLSPEVFKEYDDIDGQADLWALAVVAYRCLTGRLPFAGATLGLLSLSVLSGGHEPPSAVRSDVPAIADAWFARAFARDKAARFGSAKEMAIAFMSLIPAAQQRAGDSWPAPMVGGQSDPRLGSDTFTPTHLRARRWKGPALGGALIALLLTAGVIGVVLRHDDEPQEVDAAATPPSTEANETGPVADAAPPDAGGREAGGQTTTASSSTAGISSPPKPYWRPPPPKPPSDPHPEATSGEPPSPPPQRPARGTEDYGF